MNVEQVSAVVVRIFFFFAFVLLSVAIAEALAQRSGYTILSGWQAGRLLEYAVILLVFVVALLLRQIRDRLQKA